MGGEEGARFRVGVATAGFQIEGGYNRPNQPANNWRDWEQAGKVEPSGGAVDFWDGYDAHLDRAAVLGSNAFRLSVEWARCEPEEGQLDPAAFDRYRAILDGCRARGLEPVVTLHHFTHPAWLGPDLWLAPESPERFARWAAVAVDELGEHCSTWITSNEINVYALQTYALGMFPPGRRLDVSATIRAMDHLLTAHVLAYGEIKRRQPDAIVATNSYSFSVYELDRLLLDVLLSRGRGLARHDVGDWLRTRRDEHHAAYPNPTWLERIIRRVTRSLIPLDMALPRSLGAVFASDHERTLDVIQVDHYDPIVSNHLRLPGHRTAGGRSWLPARMLWDDPPDPDEFVASCLRNTEPGLDLWIVENGLCNRVVDGVSHPRLDGWTRPRYLAEHAAAIERAIAAGANITGYFHWTLADNYEWGSYEPRFGIFGIDRRPDGEIRWMDTDALGDDAAAAFRDVAARLRSSSPRS